MRHSIAVATLCVAAACPSLAQSAYTASRDTIRFHEVTQADVRLTTPQGEIPMKSHHVATVAIVRQQGDTARAWYEALDIGVSSPMGDQNPPTTEVLKAPFTLSMDARGRVRLISAPTFPESFQSFTDLTRQFDDFFVRLPAQPLRLGLAWSDTSAQTDSTADRLLWRRAIVNYRVERDTVVAGAPALVISVKQALSMRSAGPVPNQPVRAETVLTGTDDGIAVFSPKAGRLLARRRTGQMSGEVTMSGAMGQMSMKQSFTYTNTLDAVR
jgi:hypothetical protein